MSARYVPGTSMVLVGDRGLVATGPENVESLIALVDSELIVLAVIDSLSHGSLANLPDFACVVVDGADLRIVLRGAFTARVGDQRWSGHGVATWVEQTVLGGAESAVTIETPGASGAPDLPVSAGIVLASQVTWTSVAAVPVPVPIVEPDRATAVVEPVVRPRSDAAAPLDSDATISEPELAFDTTFGATILGRRPDDAPEPEPEPDPAPEPEPEAEPEPSSVSVLGDHDGRTITAAQFKALREQAAHQAPRLQADIVLPDGTRYPVAPRVLIGRRPEARQVSTADMPTLVTVNDPYVSSTHLDVLLDGGRLLVTDLSTNGTILIETGDMLPKGVATEIGDGAGLALSDELVVTVALKHGA